MVGNPISAFKPSTTSFRKHEELDIMNAPAPDSSNSLSSNLVGGDSISKKQLALKPKREELGLLDSIFGAGTQSRILDRDHIYITSKKFGGFLLTPPLVSLTLTHLDTPGCANAAGKLRQRWKARAVTKFT